MKDLIINNMFTKRKQVVMSLPIGQIFFNPNETVEFKSNFSSNNEIATTVRANEEMNAAQEYD